MTALPRPLIQSLEMLAATAEALDLRNDWIVFGGATPTVGTGEYLPPGSKDTYYTTSAVKGISVTSANTCGYVEW